MDADVLLPPTTADAGGWLQEKLIAERAAISVLLEQRHHELLNEFQSKFGELKQTLDAPPIRSQMQNPTTKRVKEGEQAVDLTPTEPSLSGENQLIQFSEKPQPEEESAQSQEGCLKRIDRTMTRIVTSLKFEICFGVLIIINTVVMASQRQYEGLSSAYILGYGSSTGPAHEVWPGAVDTFRTLEWIFGFLFTLEVLLKLATLRGRFLRDTWWNLYDAVIVLIWVVSWRETLILDPMMFRLARIARLLRLLRILRWLAIFDPLILMVKSIRASLAVLFWSLLLMVLVITVIAMIVSQLLEPFIRDEDVDVVKRTQVFEAWGSFTRSVETMFEVTLANWGPHCRLLMNSVNEWWALFFLMYKFTIGFSVVQVIIAVFIQQTFKVASRDEEVMIKEKFAAAQADMRNLEKLFSALDSSGDGLITRGEFDEVLTDSRVKTWFAAMEVDATEVSRLFDLLDDGDGEIGREEFIRGIKALKGGAKGTDMLALTRDVKNNHKLMSTINAKMDQLITSRSATSRPGTATSIEWV